MLFLFSGQMWLGYVVIVICILGDCEIVVIYVNWLLINGMCGQIECDVLICDVFEYNDWSQVCVWYVLIVDLGIMVWLVDGFIYLIGMLKFIELMFQFVSVYILVCLVLCFIYVNFEILDFSKVLLCGLKLGSDVIWLVMFEVCQVC